MRRGLAVMMMLGGAACSSKPSEATDRDLGHVFGDKAAELAEGDTVEVVKIVKGDEVMVKKNGQSARVRLVGVYAFSAVISDAQVSALSAGADSALEDLVVGQQVKVSLEAPITDTTGRYLAYLDKAGVDVNRRLIEEGWAVVYTEFPFSREGAYQQAQVAARKAGKNIWGLKAATDLADALRPQWDQSRARKAAAQPAH